MKSSTLSRYIATLRRTHLWLTRPNSDRSDDTGVTSDHTSITDTPDWVKVFGIIGLILVLLVVVGGGGGHGPGRHVPPGDAGSNTPLSSITEVHTPSEGSH